MGFGSPPNPAAYAKLVWDVVEKIPVGKVVTYGQIARYLAYPTAVDPHLYDVQSARWVGAAMARCPSNLPWQRVVNSQGKISPRHGAAEQRSLLESEGVLFKPNGAIDLKVFGVSLD